MSSESASFLALPELENDATDLLEQKDGSVNVLSIESEPKKCSLNPIFQTQNPTHKPCPERPKVAASTRKQDALLSASLHIPPIAMTIGLMSLSFRGVFWQVPGPSTNWILNILQFVAKINESLIVFSLTAIVWHRIRYDILGPFGIPFGLLSAGLQYSSLAIFTNSDFRHAAFADRRNFQRYASLVSIIILSFILAATSGPSAAIAALPRLEWWLLPISVYNNPPIMYLNTTLQSIFPSKVRSPLQFCSAQICPGLESCLNQAAKPSFWCPSAGLPTILSSNLMTSISTSLDVDDMKSLDSLYPAQIFLSSRLGQNQSTLPSLLRSIDGYRPTSSAHGGLAGYFVASTVPDVFAVALMQYWWGTEKVGDNNTALGVERPMVKLRMGPGKRMPQKPLVQVQCTQSKLDLNSTIIFPSNFRYWDPSSNASWGISRSSLANPAYSNVSFQWVDLGMSGVDSPSASALFTVPDIVRLYDSDGELESDWYAAVSNKTWNVFPCTIDTIWVSTDIWLDPSIDDTIHQSESNPLKLRDEFERSHDNIILDRDWLDMLNVQTSTGQTTFMTIFNFCLDNGQSLPISPQMPAGVVRCLEAAIALFMTDGLSRLQTNIGQLWMDDPLTQAPALFFPTIESPEVIDPRNSTAEYIASNFRRLENNVPFFAFDVYKYGYGYGMEGSTGIIIATAVLSTYVVVALVHVIVVVLGNWSSNTWSKPGELIALAVNSSPTEVLQNTCTGINDATIWRRMVAVRETKEAHLEIVFDEGRRTRRIVPGKRYGTI